MPHAFMPLCFIPYALCPYVLWPYGIMSYATMHPLPPIMPDSFYNHPDISSTPMIWLLCLFDSPRTWLFWHPEQLQHLVTSRTSTPMKPWWYIHHLYCHLWLRPLVYYNVKPTPNPQLYCSSQHLSTLSLQSSITLMPGHPKLSVMLSYPGFLQ